MIEVSLSKEYSTDNLKDKSLLGDYLMLGYLIEELESKDDNCTGGILFPYIMEVKHLLIKMLTKEEEI